MICLKGTRDNGRMPLEITSYTHITYNIVDVSVNDENKAIQIMHAIHRYIYQTDIRNKMQAMISKILVAVDILAMQKRLLNMHPIWLKNVDLRY